MEIKDAKHEVSPFNEEHKSIKATIDGLTCSVPIDENNRHYAEIMKQVKAGTLTIADAD